MVTWKLNRVGNCGILESENEFENKMEPLEIITTFINCTTGLSFIAMQGQLIKLCIVKYYLKLVRSPLWELWHKGGGWVVSGNEMQTVSGPKISNLIQPEGFKD